MSNAIILYYPRWAGGKFIANCLGLSDQCVLQHADLVDLQLRGLLSPTDKFNLLVDRLAQSSRFAWDDLGLGCVQLYAKPGTTSLEPDNFNEVFFALQASPLRYCIVAHTENELNKQMKILGVSSPFITLINATAFRQFFNRDDCYPELSPYDLDNVWDCEWFFDKKKCVYSIGQLYKRLGFLDFNEDLIERLYEKWIRALI